MAIWFPLKTARRKQHTRVMAGMVPTARAANPKGPLTRSIVAPKRTAATAAGILIWPSLFSGLAHFAIIIGAIVAVTGVVKDVSTPKALKHRPRVARRQPL